MAMRHQVDHLVGEGLVDKEHLRATIAPPARKEAVIKLKVQGLSNRQIAAAIGASEPTVRRDLAASNDAKTASNDALCPRWSCCPKCCPVHFRRDVFAWNIGLSY